MKKLIVFGMILFGCLLLAHSQKVVTKNIPVQGQKTEMNFRFADTIQIEAWNKNAIELHVTATIDHNRYNEFFTLDVKEQGGQIELIENVDFEGIKKTEGTKHLNNFNAEINYRLKVPANLEFDLNTISGKIILVGSQGKMAINSVSGFIDYSVPQAHQAHIGLSTVTGNVYTNLKFEEKSSSGEISWVGTKRDLSLNGGSTAVELKTVSGDIYLRKYQN